MLAFLAVLKGDTQNEPLGSVVLPEGPRERPCLLLGFLGVPWLVAVSLQSSFFIFLCFCVSGPCGLIEHSTLIQYNFILT